MQDIGYDVPRRIHELQCGQALVVSKISRIMHKNDYLLYKNRVL